MNPSDNIVSIIKNSASTVVARGGFGLARIVMLLLIARAFGAYDFGQLILVLSVVEIAKVVAEFGIDVAAIRRLASTPELTPKIMNNVLTLKVVFAVGGMVLAPLVFLLLYGTGGMELVFVLFPSIATSLLASAFLGYFQARLSVPKIVAGYLTGVAVYVGLTVVCLMLGTPLVALAAVIPLSEFFLLFLLMRRYQDEIPIRFEYDGRFVRSLLAESSLVGVSSIVVVFYLRLDNLLISALLGNEALGVYAFAFRFIEPFALLFSSLSLSLYASLSAGWAVDIAANYQSLRRVLGLSVGIAISAIVVLSFVVRPLLPVISNEFSGSGHVLLVLSFTLFFKGINTQLTAALNSLGKFRIIMLISIVNLALMLTGNLALIPLYGIIGAAFAILLTESLNTLMQAIALTIALRRLRTST